MAGKMNRGSILGWIGIGFGDLSELVEVFNEPLAVVTLRRDSGALEGHLTGDLIYGGPTVQGLFTGSGG
jgi:hypothetical protein